MGRAACVNVVECCMVRPHMARNACPGPKSDRHGVQVGRAAGVQLANVVDCCFVRPHRARNACLGRASVHLAVGRVVLCLVAVGMGSTCWTSMSRVLTLMRPEWGPGCTGGGGAVSRCSLCGFNKRV